MTGAVTVINYSSPEVNQLAAELSRRGKLGQLVRPYANLGRPWELRLGRWPITGAAYQRTLGRRKLPDGVAVEQVCEVAVAQDFALAIARRFGRPLDWLVDDLHWDIQLRLAKAGADQARDAEFVFGSYQVAADAFEICAGRKILNYPIAHHRYIQKVSEEEAARVPAFAPTLPKWDEHPDWVERKLDRECELADAILLGSEFARQTFVSEGIPAEKLCVQPYGADLSLFSPGARSIRPGGHFEVLFVGQLAQRKGISYLLEAMKRLQGRGISLHLVGNHFGSMAPLEPFRSLFRHTPNVDQQTLAGIYREADVLVLPSLIEGMGLVVLEAMASGRPVIVSRNGPADLVRDGIDGFIVPIRDPDAIAERIENLRANPDLAAEMGRNARERALTFSWQRFRNACMEQLFDVTGED